MPCMHYITINFSWLVVLLSLIADTQTNSSVPTAFHWFILRNDALTGLFIMLTPVKRGKFDTSSNVTRDLFDAVELIIIYRQCTGKHDKKESHLAYFNQLVIFLLSYLCYSYKVYKACKQLAAIDWNFHMNLEAATTKAGERIVTRKYNQRTKDWDVKIITVKKKFEYIPVMMVKIFNMRKKRYWYCYKAGVFEWNRPCFAGSHHRW